MITFSHVSFGYGKEGAEIRNLNFHIDRGEFVAIIGENGAGKSTTSKLMNGLLKPDSGSVTVNGMNTKEVRVSQLAKHIGFLFQNPDRQLCQNTVREELRFGLRLVSNESEQMQAGKAEQMMARLSLDGDSDPFLLSRGERQRVALASVLVTEPEILILDEPTTGLDYRECIGIMDEVQRLNRDRQVTVVMVCHDMEIVLDYASRILVMAGGTLVADGPTREIFRNLPVMKRASIVPPQMIALASRLGGPFADVNHVDEMVSILKETQNRKNKEDS